MVNRKAGDLFMLIGSVRAISMRHEVVIRMKEREGGRDGKRGRVSCGENEKGNEKERRGRRKM